VGVTEVLVDPKAPVRVRPLVLAPAHLAQALGSVDESTRFRVKKSITSCGSTVLSARSGPEIRRIGPICRQKLSRSKHAAPLS
jgi:hypothetical protein